MKKIVIFKDSMEDSTTPGGRPFRRRTILRTISPSSAFIGYTKKGSLIDSEVRKLCEALEPGYTGYFAS